MIPGSLVMESQKIGSLSLSVSLSLSLSVSVSLCLSVSLSLCLSVSLSLYENTENVKHRLGRLEQELDSVETISKQSNLKFLGVTEREKENFRACAEQIVDILNECSSSRTRKKSETAYRMGDRRRRSDQSRPLIVRYRRWSDRKNAVDEMANDAEERHH